MAVYQEWKRQRLKKNMQGSLKIVSCNTIQRIYFQFFFEEMIRIDLVWEIVKYIRQVCLTVYASI